MKILKKKDYSPKQSSLILKERKQPKKSIIQPNPELNQIELKDFKVISRGFVRAVRSKEDIILNVKHTHKKRLQAIVSPWRSKINGNLKVKKSGKDFVIYIEKS